MMAESAFLIIGCFASSGPDVGKMDLGYLKVHKRVCQQRTKVRGEVDFTYCRLAPFRNVPNAPGICIVKRKVLQAMEYPNLFGKALMITKESQVIKSSYGRAGRREV